MVKNAFNNQGGYTYAAPAVEILNFACESVFCNSGIVYDSANDGYNSENDLGEI